MRACPRKRAGVRMSRMTPSKPTKSGVPASARVDGHRRLSARGTPTPSPTSLVVITGMSGSGKASVLKAFEDMGYYAVDNLPVELMPRFAELVKQSGETDRAALVVDIREGTRLDR